MAEHLQQLLAIQRELVRAVSHELRTPVARLRFGLEMIGSRPRPRLGEKYLEGMDSDIQDLDGLVDEMLTYARLEQGSPELNFQRVDLDALQPGDRRIGATASSDQRDQGDLSVLDALG
jgi:two-component system sensor histidine kinase RstB